MFEKLRDRWRPTGWDSVQDDEGMAYAQRAPVPGGWVYRYFGTMGQSYVFVPDPDQWARAFTVPAPIAAQIALELPIRRNTQGDIMPNFELPNDEVVTITIKTTTSSGSVVPVPSGDTFTATSSNPASLGVAVGTDASGAPAIVLTPLVQASPGLTVTVADSSGLAQASQIVDIVADVTPANVVLDLADATHTSQAVPTNAGP